MTEPRWFTDEEEKAWCSFLTGIRALIEVFDHELQAESGLLPSYFELMSTLAEHPARALRMSELAEVTRSSRSRLSRAVARLEERGWVRRVECPGDRRGHIAELTDDGLAIYRATAPEYVAVARKYLIDLLTRDQLTAIGEVGEAVMQATAMERHPLWPSRKVPARSGASVTSK